MQSKQNWVIISRCKFVSKTKERSLHHLLFFPFSKLEVLETCYFLLIEIDRSPLLVISILNAPYLIGFYCLSCYDFKKNDILIIILRGKT